MMENELIYNDTITLLVNLVLNDIQIKGLQPNVDDKTLNELLENKLQQKIGLIKAIILTMMVDKESEEYQKVKNNVAKKLGIK